MRCPVRMGDCPQTGSPAKLSLVMLTWEMQ